MTIRTSSSTPPCRIVCIGNRLYRPDNAGPLVHDILADMTLPDNTQLIDGGLSGLDLLPVFDHCSKVIFVDSVRGFLPNPGVYITRLPNPDIAIGSYGHDAGIGFLFKTAQEMTDSKLPPCILVGIEGETSDEICLKAATSCLYLASSHTDHTVLS